MEVTPAMVKELRAQTNAGVLDCKKALDECQGDMEGAVRVLREKGLAVAAKKAGREAKDGLIEAYIHHGSRIGVLLELSCETDFVAHTNIFRDLAHDLAMQIAANSPLYIQQENVPPDVIESEKSIYRAQLADSGKPPQIVDRIVTGKLEAYFKDSCLVLQTFVKDPEMTVGQLIQGKIAELGENIIVRRFVRYELGS